MKTYRLERFFFELFCVIDIKFTKAEGRRRKAEGLYAMVELKKLTYFRGVIKNKTMYRTIFIPTEMDSMIPLNIPREWYGRNVELIAFPLDLPQTKLSETARINKNRFKAIPSKYLFGTKNFKFNRDEANDYE